MGRDYTDTDIRPGSRVAVTLYGQPYTGIVTRRGATSDAITFVLLDGQRHERWMHTDSLTIIASEPTQ